MNFFVCRDTNTCYCKAIPEQLGLIKLAGCVEYIADIDNRNYFNLDNPVMFLTQVQCKTLFGSFPEQERAYLVTKVDSHTPVWERVDEDLLLMEFHNGRLRKARIVEE